MKQSILIILLMCCALVSCGFQNVNVKDESVTLAVRNEELKQSVDALEKELADKEEIIKELSSEDGGSGGVSNASKEIAFFH